MKTVDKDWLSDKGFKEFMDSPLLCKFMKVGEYAMHAEEGDVCHRSISLIVEAAKEASLGEWTFKATLDCGLEWYLESTPHATAAEAVGAVLLNARRTLASIGEWIETMNSTEKREHRIS